MEELRRRVYALALRMGAQREDAEDIAQEAMLRLSRARADGRGIANEGAFALRAGARLAIDRLRKATRHAAGLRQLRGARQAEVEQSEMPLDVATLHSAIAKLPGRQATVIVMRKVMELEYADIAAVLGISIATCHSHCRHGLERLRQILGRQGMDK